MNVYTRETIQIMLETGLSVDNSGFFIPTNFPRFQTCTIEERGVNVFKCIVEGYDEPFFVECY